MQLYAHQVKGADQYLLGAMATATVVARVAFGVPLGRLADRIGRKRIIYILTPFWYASNILLVMAPNAVTLVLSAALQVSYSLSSGVAGAMTLELVPLEEQGKWSGVLGLFTGLVSMPGPILGGFIWRELGPKYVFLIPVVFDLLLRIPLLAAVSETLRANDHDGARHPAQDAQESEAQ